MPYRALIALCLCALTSLTACRSQRVDPARVTQTPTVVPTAAAAQPATSPRTTTGEGTLLLMADIRGVLRPCGCTKDLQKGGFERLKPHLEAERAAHPGAHLLHAGPLFYEGAEVEASKKAQRARQVEVAAELIQRVGIDTVALTAVDLAASKGKLSALLQTAKVGATVGNLSEEGREAYPRYLVRQVGGLNIGIFALASDAHTLDGTVTVTSPLEAARQIVSDMAPKVDVVVLLSSLGLREVKRLVRKVPGIHFAIAGGLGEYPVQSDEAELVKGTRVMQFHREGRYVGRLSIRLVGGDTQFVDASQPDEATKGRSTFEFAVTSLDWDRPQDPELLALMDAFDEELKAINLKNVGTLPEPKPGQAVYVGVDECLGCHDEVQAFWDADRHHKAWETLVDLKKTFDIECVSCHVTGYGEAGGSILGKTEGREDVQCEACHGPGSIHAESEDPDDIVADPGEAVCVTCHNSHHSPKFNFKAWKKRITVPGHGLPL